ncbi:pyrroline-5-carboxylate reductase [Maricaulaceae bacterium NA33B04]|nr:pyrroline-5-carboxylate reductase [Maricaulaceae bacterium NA33B04]
MTCSILMVGCGNMGGALLARWIKLDGVDVTVMDPGSPILPDGVSHIASLDELDDARFDAMIVAVKPQLISKAIPPPAEYLKDGGVAVSIAAGTSADVVSEACGGAAVVRLMPNMPARVGQGVSGLYAQGAVTEAQRALATKLAEAVGVAIWVQAEDAIDRITAAAGSGPGYVFEFARTYQDAAEEMGFSPKEARRLVLETMLGCMMLAAEGETSFELLRDSIMSKGGTTAAGVSALNDDGALSTHISAALKAAYERAVELRA